jgi:hypothetical protein
VTGTVSWMTVATGLRDVAQIRQGLVVFHSQREEVMDSGVGKSRFKDGLLLQQRRQQLSIAVETKANNNGLPDLLTGACM